MPINEETLLSFVGTNTSVLDEIMGSDANEIKSLLSTGAISGMKDSEILGQLSKVTTSKHAAKAMMNTKLNTLSRVATNTMMKDAPADTKYVYVGVIDDRTRDDCLDMASAGALTEEQIISQFGAAPLVDGGGINCRHKWEIASEEGTRFHEPEAAQQAIEGKQDNITSLSMAGKFTNTKDAIKFILANGVENEAISNMTIGVVNEITSALAKIPSKYRNNIVLGNFANFKRITGRKLSGGSHNYGVSISVPKVDTKLLTFAEKKAIFESPLSGGDFHVIGINTRKYKTLEKITKRKLLIQQKYYNQKGRNYFLNTDGKITVHHEFGHIVHNQLSSQQRKLWDDIAKAWAETANADLLKVKQGWTEHYAEAFAEAWGAYNAGDKSLLPLEVKEFIKEVKK